MKNILLILGLSSFMACQGTTETEQWIPLWNGEDLEGWQTYLGTPFQLEVDSAGVPYEPFGVDNDPMKVITVVPTEAGNAIRISGEAWGMAFTRADFANYHLKLKMKWGNDRHPPRENERRDSGLLYHGFGEPGSAYNWMHSQELQVQQGDLGDYWPVGDVEIDVPSRPLDSLYYIYHPEGDLRTYYFADILETNQHDSLARRRVYKAFDAEKPHGEWNDVELITYGDSSIHIVNGEVVMRLYNSRTMTDKRRLASGKIILQSEGAEVFYKDLYLKKIKEIPKKYN